MVLKRRKTENNRAPNVLVPWLATGIGLFAMTTSSDLSTTDPAYAFSPTDRAALASPSLGSSIQRMATAPARLVLSSEPGSTASASAALSLGALTPSPAHSMPVDRLFQIPGRPVRPLPRTSDSVAEVGQETISMDSKWDQLRHCEATNNYAATNFSGKFRGAYQFDFPTWESVGGTGDPAAASPAEQDKRARILFEQRGSSPWPECGYYLDE